MFLNAQGAACILCVTPDTVREWARAGIIPAAKLGKEWRFDDGLLREHIKSLAQKNIKSCPSLNAKIQRISGVDSRSVVERFARAQAHPNARKPKNSKPIFAVVTGGKSS